MRDFVRETYRATANIKTKEMLCNVCQEHYNLYCPNCDMLVIVTSSTTQWPKGKAELTLPMEVLSLCQSSFEGESIVARRTIPSGVLFGPYKGFPSVNIGTKNIWKIKHSRFLDISNIEGANWLAYVNSSVDVNNCNLIAVENQNELYFKSSKRIQKGEELVLFYKPDPCSKGYIEPQVVKFNIVYSCYDCCLGFSTDKYLELHKEMYHSERAVDRYNFSCNVCSRQFNDNQSYDQHSTNCFVNNNLFDVYSCSICEANFDSKPDLQNHVGIHINPLDKNNLGKVEMKSCTVLLNRVENGNTDGISDKKPLTDEKPKKMIKKRRNTVYNDFACLRSDNVEQKTVKRRRDSTYHADSVCRGNSIINGNGGNLVLRRSTRSSVKKTCLCPSCL